MYQLRVDEFSGLVQDFGHYGDMIIADVIGESGLALKALCHCQDLHTIRESRDSY